MAVQEVTLSLPEAVDEQIRRAAEHAKWPVNDLLVEAVVAAAPAGEALAGDMRSALAQMAYLNDAALWQAARATMPVMQRERLESLHIQQQRGPLTAEEAAEEQVLLKLYRDTIVVRAQAAMLLKQRGYNIADQNQFAPLEWAPSTSFS